MKATLMGLFLSITTGIWAQGPGGVTPQLKMWMRSDLTNTITITAGRISEWRYVLDASKRFTGTGSQRPLLQPETINFQPVVRFSGAQIMNGPTGTHAPIPAGDDDYCLFAVWTSPYKGGAGERIWTQWNCVTQGQGFSLATAFNGTSFMYGAQFEIWPYGQGIQQSFTPGTWQLSQLNVLNQGTQDLAIIHQQNITTAPLLLSSNGANGNTTRSIANYNHVIGANCDRSVEPFRGDLAELIVYDRPIAGIERDKVFSYLALKYGISIPGFNYVAPDWNGTTGVVYWRTDPIYNNDIFGIGRDESASGSLLNLARSNSLNTGSGNGTGQAGKGNIILMADAATMDNGEYLVVANDARSFAETTTDLPITMDGAKRIQREWKVQHTGNIGPLGLSFDMNGLTLSGDVTKPSNFALLIDVDGDGNFTNGTTNYVIASAITNGRLIFNHVALAHNSVFTIVTEVPASLLLNDNIPNRPNAGVQEERIFPNPFHDHIRMQLKLEKKQLIRMDLYNATGLRVKHREVTAAKGMQSFTLEHLPALPAGVYKLLLYYNNRLATHTLLKVK